MESFTAFMPINRNPLTCPSTPQVPSDIKLTIAIIGQA